MSLRYSRQIAVPEIGKEGQKKISDSKVLIVGCGALGSMVAMQLAGAGVGSLGIADYDNIDISNLQRQFFYTTEEASGSKVEVLAQRIHDLNPDVSVTTYKEIITPRKCESIFPDYDFIVDATDNPDSKKMVGEMSYKYGKGCCIGGIRNFEGQVMTFLKEDPRFEDFFGTGETEGLMPCSLGGVFGPAAALCATLLASETLKCIVGIESVLSGKILCFNLLHNTFHQFSI